MKKLAWIFALLLQVMSAVSQWTTSGTNIYNSNGGNVGIGTTTPARLLDVNGAARISGNLYFTLQAEQYITASASTGNWDFTNGAGGGWFFRWIQNGATPMTLSTANNLLLGTTTDAGYRLQVNGTLWTTGLLLPTGAGAGKVLTSDASGNATWQTASSANSWTLGGNTAGAVKTLGTIDNYDLAVVTNNTERMRVTAAGSLAIGTTNPQGYMLAVNGSAIFTGVWVKLNANWPDYVFQQNYDLPSLKSVAQYIRVNGHLPDIPSADNIARNGIDLGDNQAALLKKIEELTLYIIAQDKTAQSQNQKVEELAKALDAQRDRINRLEKLIERLDKK